MPSFNYMIGRTNDPGMESVEGVGTNKGSLRYKNSIKLRSGLRIIKHMDVSLNYNYNQNENTTTTKTGDHSESWFYSEKSGGFPIPEWSLKWTGLERIAFFKTFAQNISFDHSFSGNKQESWQNNPNQKTKSSFTKAFRPLGGLNITLKKKISVNIRYNLSENINLTQRGGSGGQKTSQSDLFLKIKN
jgi:hypothetical protein